MSKVKIEGNASGTGTLTISAPNTDTDRSITLPDGAGEILTDATGLTSSSGLNATNLTSGTIPDARFPSALPAIDGSALTNLPGGGKVIGAKIIPITSNFSTTSSTVVSTNHTTTYTPAKTNSTIIVKAHCTMYKDDMNASTYAGGIYRDSTALFANTGYSSYDFIIHNWTGAGSGIRMWIQQTVVGASTAHTAGTSYTWALKVNAGGSPNIILYSDKNWLEIVEYDI